MHPTATQRTLPVLIAALAGFTTGAAHAAFPSSFDLSALDGSNGARIDGVQAGDFLGYSFARAGDVNNDGIADFIVGAPNSATFPGAAYVVYGKPQGLLHPLDLSALTGAVDGFRIDGAFENGQLGAAAGAARDVNGDGIADVIVGAPGESAAYVIFGRNGSTFADSISVSRLDGSNGFRIGGVLNGRLGYSVAGAGDVNGDGIGDVVVSNGAANAGVAYVLFGSGGGFAPNVDAAALNGGNGFAIGGAGTNQGYFQVGGAGDVNGDGFADLIVGSPNAAAAYVVFGGSGFAASVDVNSLDGANGLRLTGPAGSFFGNGAAGAGDVNGDGFADVIVGAPMASTDSTNNQAGKTYVVFGKAGAFAPSLSVASLNGSNGGFQIYGAASGDRSGWSVGAASDINGDGINDLAIGAPYSRYNGTAAGASYVVFGHAGAFPSPINLSGNPVMPNHLDGSNGFQLVGVTGDMSGWTVGGGDVNGDGADDLFIGARLATVSGLSNAGRGYVFYGHAADSTPPRTAVASTPAANAYGWNNAAVSFTVTAQDEAGGSGLKETRCALDPASAPGGFDALPVGGCANPAASSEGIHVLYATSVDNAGNKETPVSRTARIDLTAPGVAVTGLTDGATYRKGKVPKSGCSTGDALSGVAVYASLTVTGGSNKGTGTFTATCSGALDLAGNPGSASVTYTVK
jgi:hypothetical protein